MRNFIIICLLACFAGTSVTGFCPLVQAESFSLPPVSVMPLSARYNPPLLRGIKVNPHHPLRLEFILDKGNKNFVNDQIRDESTKQIKYFLASLTIPGKDLWVN